LKPLHSRLSCLVLAAGCLCAGLGSAPSRAAPGHASSAAAFRSASSSGSADALPLVLENLTTAEGLPQGSVNATLQDSQGFIWLGTQDGLVRFDGHELVRYAYSREARSGLPGNFIYQIVEDAQHDLWIAVKDAGIARWNRASDTFTVYRHDPRNAGSLASDSVRALLIDTRGRVWIGTIGAGVDVLDSRSGRIEHLRHEPARADSLIDDHVRTLSLDRAGNVWIGTEAGLDEWSPGHPGFNHFRHTREDPRSLSSNQISRVLEDRSGELWVATFDAGLDRLDRDGRVVQVFRHDAGQPGSLSNDDVRALLEDQAGRLWVGTAGGLDLLDRATGQFSHYRHDPSDSESLPDSFIMSLYQDATGLIWIGTESGGVSRWNPRAWELGGHRPDWLVGKFVAAFADAPDSKVWIASLGGGLVQFDPDTGKTVDLGTLLGRRLTIDKGRVMSLREDQRGNLWIGTFADGLKRLDRNGQLESFAAKPGDPHGLAAAGIMTLFEARDGRIWIGTFGGGANVLDPATGLVEQLPYGSAVQGAVSAPNVIAIAEDSQGNFWIGTDGGGLDLARGDGTVVKVFRHDPNDPSSLPADTVWSIAVDAHDTVWVGTNGGGLARVDGSPAAPGKIRFHVLAREEGLSSDTIYGVLPDASGRIWLSGNAGLMRLDPETGAVKTFHREDGLQGEEFDTEAYHRLRDGRLCFGGPGGFNIFDPLKLSGNRPPPRLALTGVEVLGVPAPSATPYWLRNRIALDYRASIVSLDIGVLDFAAPSQNRLAYRMSGLTDRWIDLGNQHRITLTNLDSGDHVLEVRGANSDSVWTPVPLRLTLHRSPAPWRSPWAYGIYALAALALLARRLYRQRLRFRRIVEEQQRLEREVEARTHELSESNRQLAEAAQAKSNFLDRISHELRTPMNGVVGMTELLALTTLSPTQKRLTRTIRTSAQVMLRIVNDLLDLSRIRSGKVELEELPLDLAQILEECTVLFSGAAEAKGIELIVCPPPRVERTLLGDPLRLRQILMNLVGNAVKFTAQGEVVVKADIELTSERPVAKLSVADTGVGMDAATVGKIFEPFTQADESTTRRFGGSGLGLAICRELAELMGGTITVESRPQVGSTFRLTLPLAAGEESPRREAEVPPRRTVRIVTRRPALAESLARHATLLGLEIRHDASATDPGTPREDLLIIDAGAPAEELARALLAQPGSAAEPAVVVVASARESEREDLRRLAAAVAIVQKPVQRDALLEAVSSALGVALVPASDAGRSSSVPAMGAHVLLVEDEPVNAAVAQGYLAALGCTSVWVKDGAEAITRHATERFDLVLMDLNMPNLDGFATARLIRQRAPSGRLPIVAVTANDGVDRRDSCLAAGMDDMLSKPYSLEDCARVLRRWIGRAQPSETPPEGPPNAPSSDPRPAPGPAPERLSKVDLKTVAGLRRLRGGGQSDLYSQLVDLFRTGSTEAIAELGAALESGELHAAAAICHKLKSSASNVGAIPFARSVRELEQWARAGDLARAREVYHRLREAHPQLLRELADLRLRASA
jgi:signal transduction histidine kinase/ligand-binding sensor domain-containing protein/DNA-binding NarL/FixJ family response regulator/HPt (histidine-containing phosphotransfer) domain-containing protein